MLKLRESVASPVDDDSNGGRWQEHRCDMMFLYDGKKLYQVAHTLYIYDATAIGKWEMRASDSPNMIQWCCH